MKKILFVVLMASFSLSTLAGDCTKAYRAQAKKRSQVNANLKAAAVSTVGLASIVLTPVPLITIGLGSTVLAPALIAANPRKKNNYYKALLAIEKAKVGVVTPTLLGKIDRKFSYYASSEYEQDEINKKIIDILIEGNNTKEICVNSHHEIKPLSFNKLANYILERLHE